MASLNVLLCTVKQVETVRELALAEKPNRSRFVGSRKVQLDYHPRMHKLTARGHSFSLSRLAISPLYSYIAGRQVVACGRKTSHLVVFLVAMATWRPLISHTDFTSLDMLDMCHIVRLLHFTFPLQSLVAH